jgi:N-acetylglucosaminyldiphosphoundecaprenol N-acetyl-beta-D-mannosaminyltransferase
MAVSSRPAVIREDDTTRRDGTRPSVVRADTLGTDGRRPGTRTAGDADDPMNTIEWVRVLDVPISRVTNEEALALLKEFVRSDAPHVVVTADAAAVVTAAADPEFRAVVHGADLVTPDSAGMLWAARRLGSPLPERVSGVDLVDQLCRLAGKHGWSVFFYGAAPGVAEAAAARLQERCPGMRIAGTAHGFLSETEQIALEERIREAKPDLLFVAMGIPRQEKWIWKRKEALGVPVAMGVGGSFDVFAGRVTRAPVWMQRHSLEWLYRLCKNPRKISKVASLPRFVLLVLRRGRRG